MIGDLERWHNDMSDEKADTILVDQVKGFMQVKLSKKRKQGYGGWHKLDVCNNKELLERLKTNLDQGDYVDVINLAGMIIARTNMYGSGKA